MQAQMPLKEMIDLLLFLLIDKLNGMLHSYVGCISLVHVENSPYITKISGESCSKTKLLSVIFKQTFMPSLEPV